MKSVLIVAQRAIISLQVLPPRAFNYQVNLIFEVQPLRRALMNSSGFDGLYVFLEFLKLLPRKT
jgi:hypothetical protein